MVTFILALVGCQTQREGVSSFEMLPPPRPIDARPPTTQTVSAAESDIRIVHVPVRPRRSLASPVYPPEALAARSGIFTAYVTLTVNEAGRVVDVHPSVVRLHLPNDFAAAFYRAIEVAISTWEFEPARYVYWRRVPNEDDRYLRADPVKQTMEVRFVFTETGTVR